MVPCDTQLKYLSTKVHCVKELVTARGKVHNVMLRDFSRLDKDNGQWGPNFLKSTSPG